MKINHQYLYDLIDEVFACLDDDDSLITDEQYDEILEYIGEKLKEASS